MADNTKDCATHAKPRLMAAISSIDSADIDLRLAQSQEIQNIRGRLHTALGHLWAVVDVLDKLTEGGKE